MQDNIGWILLGGCGFGLLSMFLGIFAYKQFRRLIGKFFIVGIVNKIIGDTEQDIATAGDDEAYRRPHTHPTEADLRAQADAFDFEAAIAQKTGQIATQSAPQSAPQSATLSATAQTAAKPEPAPRPASGEPHLRRHDDDEPDDDIYDDDDDD